MAPSGTAADPGNELAAKSYVSREATAMTIRRAEALLGPPDPQCDDTLQSEGPRRVGDVVRDAMVNGSKSLTDPGRRGRCVRIEKRTQETFCELGVEDGGADALVGGAVT